MRFETFDIAVIGGGPAGCATALALRLNVPQFSVVLLEASRYENYRAGEILPPAARSLLRSLGVLKSLDDHHHRIVSRGIVSAWGSPHLEENQYFFSANGGGWHLDRNRFDAMFADECERSGVRVLRGATLRRASGACEQWQLHTDDGTVSAGFVVDASGRAAVFARMQGARFEFRDRLTSYSRIFAGTDCSITETLVESSPRGWWYTAPLPDGRRIVSYMTDADLGRAAGLPSTAAWTLLLYETMHTRSAIGLAPAAFGGCIVRAAATARLDRVRGEGWLATGDASAACDPLAAQGITKGMRNGMLASYAVADTLLDRGSRDPDRYSAILEWQFAGYERAHREYFARETRWSDSPFWMRRQPGCIAQSTGDV